MTSTLPDRWAVAPLREIGLLVSGNSPAGSLINQVGVGTPYVTGPEQWTGSEVHIDKWTTASVKIVPDRSIFIVVKGRVGTVFPGIASAIGRDIVAFVPYEPLNIDYLTIVLGKVCADMSASARGQIPGISRSDLLGLSIDIPPLEEQARIVARVNETDHLLAQARQRFDSARRDAANLRDSFLLDAFQGHATAHWRSEHAADADATDAGSPIPHPEQDQPVVGTTEATSVRKGKYAIAVGRPHQSPVPGWQWARLAEVATLRTGHTPSRRESGYWDGDIPWIGIKDARENYGQTIFDTNQHITAAGLAHSSAELLPVGTLCLSRTASIGYVVVTGATMATSQDFLNWTCGPDIDSAWLLWLLIAERSSLESFGRGSTHKTIYMDDAIRIHVLLPPRREQEEVAAFIAEKMQEVENVLEAIGRAETAANESHVNTISMALGGQLDTGMRGDSDSHTLLNALRKDVKISRSSPQESGSNPQSVTVDRLIETVLYADDGLRPEDLFAAAGYRSDAVDLFYSHIKAAVAGGQVRYDSASDRVVGAVEG